MLWAQVRNKTIRLVKESDSQPAGIDWYPIDKEAEKTAIPGARYDRSTGAITAAADAPALPLSPRQQALAIAKSINKKELDTTDAGKALHALLLLNDIIL